MPIEGFFADFACLEAGIVIELDGGQHAGMVEADALRSAAIEGAGFLVIRFWNNDVLARIDAVMDEIDQVLRGRSGASD